MSNILVCVILVILILGVIYQLILKKESFENDSGSNLNECYKLDTNMCSPDCCGSQWPISFDIQKDPRIKEGELGGKFISTNMTCSGKMGTGCVCASRSQYSFLSDRGTNA